MNERTRALVALSAALARGSRGEWQALMTRALDACTPAEIEEAILQSYLFLGYPAALQALAAWRALAGPASSAEGALDVGTWRSRGEAVCATVYGGQYQRLRENVARLHPDVEQWMLTEGYGKVLGRPGLDLPTRELCIIALLAAQDAPAQLTSHLRGALNTGASVQDVDDVVLGLSGALPSERAQAVRQVWSDLRARWMAREFVESDVR